MISEKKDHTGNADNENINEIISELDSGIENISSVLRKSLQYLEQNPEWRLFIAERIYNLTIGPRSEIEALYNEEAENVDLRFWLSTILVEYRANETYLSELLKYVKSQESIDDSLAFNILVQHKIEGIGDVIINRLENMDFSKTNFDKINFYLEKLIVLDIFPTDGIKGKIDEYNRSVEFKCEKLIC